MLEASRRMMVNGDHDEIEDHDNEDGGAEDEDDEGNL